MPALSASAPGKVILFGEHAVVYGQPAIAAPVLKVQAKVIVTPLITGTPGEVRIEAAVINLDTDLNILARDHPIAAAIHHVFAELGVKNPPAFKLRVTSTIPLAAGLGSGAAVSVAIIRAVSAFLGRPLKNERVSLLAYEIEKLHHGTPSGIDNTVITYEKSVFFQKGEAPIPLKIEAPFLLLIADTGLSTPTKVTVGDVHSGWQADPPRYEAIFAEIGDLSRQARTAIEAGDAAKLGPLMNSNHELLRQLNVSSLELDTLVSAALAAGALGAKMSGGGRGGNIIALAPHNHLNEVKAALDAAGAKKTLVTEVK
jgi:mevalonate kinase